MDLIFWLQGVDSGLVADFLVWVFGILGLDMRFCWVFWTS
jgi:hypothetical protein